MPTKTANVVSAGPAEHPQSEKDLMRIQTDAPWTTGGERGVETEIWGPRDMPEPQTGESITWGARHLWFRGVKYDKPEFDDNPDAPLH